MNNQKLLTGKEIKQARLEKNLSQEELAEITGICRKTISVWESQPDKVIKKPHSMLLHYIFKDSITKLTNLLPY